MPLERPRHIEVYVLRRRAGRVEFLCLRRAAGEWLPGAWQPVTGRIERAETALAAAVREVREETGLSPRRWWGLESVTVYFDVRADAVRALPLFAAEVTAGDRVRLSAEHTDAVWLPAAAAGRRFVWEAQRAGLAAVKREVLRGGPLARALECTDLAVGTRRNRAVRATRARRARS